MKFGTISGTYRPTSSWCVPSPKRTLTHSHAGNRLSQSLSHIYTIACVFAVPQLLSSVGGGNCVYPIPYYKPGNKHSRNICLRNRSLFPMPVRTDRFVSTSTDYTDTLGRIRKTNISQEYEIIHHSGFSLEELLINRMTVYRHLISTVQPIVLAMRKMGLIEWPHS